MIKIDNIQTYGWEGAFRGMRNPLNSWAKSDSFFYPDGTFSLGEADLNLAKRLVKAGTEHRKFLRFIHVQMDITAPSYFIFEQDTYKIATARNSCSFMHKGLAKPFTIDDFTTSTEVQKLLNRNKEWEDIEYPYETNEYKIYTCENGRQYKVYKNGRVFSCAFEVNDNYKSGRTRHFAEKELKPHKNPRGYFELNLGGRCGTEKWQLHRLMAYVWIPAENWQSLTVNHINGKKHQNNIENLEWCSREENISKGFQDGLYDDSFLYNGYDNWKRTMTTDIETRLAIRYDHNKGLMPAEIAKKYEVPLKTVYGIIFGNKPENYELFMHAYWWEKTVDYLNELRDQYLDTQDESIFLTIRQALPMGYNYRYTYDCSLETLLNMCKQRVNHRLPEWRVFVSTMLEKIPYLKDFYEVTIDKN